MHVHTGSHEASKYLQLLTEVQTVLYHAAGEVLHGVCLPLPQTAVGGHRSELFS